MDNAKPNERPWPAEGAGWSSRLEEPGALPGVGLTDKEAAWDKLYDRLRETPRRRTLPWLWAAAACLLLALIPAAFFLREKRAGTSSREPKVATRPQVRPQPIIKPTQARKYPAPAPTPSTGAPGTLTQNTRAQSNHTPNTSSNSPTPGSKLIANNHNIATSPHPARTAHHNHAKAPALAPIMAKAPAQRIEPGRITLPDRNTLTGVNTLLERNTFPGRNRLPGLNLPPRPDLTKPQTAAIQPPAPKKQPRVVHINELEPAQPTPSTAGERLKPGRLQVRFTQPETFRPATTYNNEPIDRPIIPIKHTQNP